MKDEKEDKKIPAWIFPVVFIIGTIVGLFLLGYFDSFGG